MLDIDECADRSNDCSPNALCVNTPGSFSCACNQGYSGSGITCSGERGIKTLLSGIRIFMLYVL